MEYLTIPEACAALRVSRRSLFRLLSDGKLVRVKPTGDNGVTRITKESLEAYRESLLPVLR